MEQLALSGVQAKIGAWSPRYMEISMKASFAALAFLLTATAACNAVEGVGENATVAGQAVDDAAEDARN